MSDCCVQGSEFDFSRHLGKERGFPYGSRADQEHITNRLRAQSSRNTQTRHLCGQFGFTLLGRKSRKLADKMHLTRRRALADTRCDVFIKLHSAITASYSLGWLVKLVVAAVAVTLILR